MAFTYAQKKFSKDKKVHVNKNGVRYCKVKKLKMTKASGATINASCCRNENSSCILGLCSHLEYNSMHWDCAIKYDSHYKKYKHVTFCWYECMQCKEDITLHPKEYYICLINKLKDEVITPLIVKSNSPEWF